MQLQLIKVKCGVKRENQFNVTFNVFKMIIVLGKLLPKHF